MQRCLASNGIRPINNLVDITNYVMEEFGQPMHAYDLDTIAKHEIVVRCAGKDEKFVTLDGQERIMDENVLMICDGEKPVGIAGIMGGDTAFGFVSFYGQFCRGPEDFLWVIKGGPGCGKSSFMKTIGRAAENAGLDVEYVLCSGDPDSVDGVYLPALHTGYADGTAPHVLEAVTPGAAGLYLDLGQFYDRIALQKERRAIELLQTRYRALYREAYARLAVFARPSCPLPAQEERKKRFLRAVTCRGLYSAEPPAGAVQLVSGEELEALRARETAVLYQNPLFPDETEAVYLPDEKRYYRGPDAPLPDLSDVTALLAQAKALHDELEAIYNPHVDFARVYALANSHALRLFKEN